MFLNSSLVFLINSPIRLTLTYNVFKFEGLVKLDIRMYRKKEFSLIDRITYFIDKK